MSKPDGNTTVAAADDRSCRVASAAARLEGRGVLWLIGAFLFCPCHLPSYHSEQCVRRAVDKRESVCESIQPGIPILWYHGGATGVLHYDRWPAKVHCARVQKQRPRHRPPGSEEGGQQSVFALGILYRGGTLRRQPHHDTLSDAYVVEVSDRKHSPASATP